MIKMAKDLRVGDAVLKINARAMPAPMVLVKVQHSERYGFANIESECGRLFTVLQYRNGDVVEVQG